MVHNSLAEIFEAMDETRARLYDRLEKLESADEAKRAAPDSWSVAEVVEHLAVFEEGMTKLFNIILTKAEAGGMRRAEGQPFRPVSLDHFAERSRQEKYTAPEIVRPRGATSVADSVARLRRAREAIHALRPRIEELDLASMTYPHPAFGPLDFYQWLVMIGLHEDRHLRQIEAILAAPELQASGA